MNVRVHTLARALIYRPSSFRATADKCVVMDCDGPKHVVLHDLDGSLTGNGAHSSVLGRAEFMNELRADEKKFTWYKRSASYTHLSPHTPLPRNYSRYLPPLTYT